MFSYFRGLVDQFEVQLQQFRQQIEELENHLTTQSSGSHITPQGENKICFYLLWCLINLHEMSKWIYIFLCFVFWPTDLTLAMQKLYQTFVAQAAQLQSVHENVKVSS